ncbi:MAG: acyl-CoA synthetase [Halothiobacillaceae bacterium]|nr:acyl-CoA synthetase [Halothiobacillaceae bacterium]
MGKSPRRLALFGEGDLERVILWSPDRAWTAGDLLDSAQALSDRLRARARTPRYLINLATRRDDFVVGLLAGMLGGQMNLMPSTHTPGAINDLGARYPRTVILHGSDATLDVSIDESIPRVAIRSPVASAPRHVKTAMPLLREDAIVARVFTSGSTGTPSGHDKTWGRLVANARNAARALAAEAELDNPPLHLLGTVPSQHMYGFESLVLAALCGDAVLSTDQPFFPSDIADGLARLPTPRALVTTPYHLQHLLAAEITLPRCERILCATAPLDPALAREAESRLGGVLQEIYGSTETGQIAVRRPCKNDQWSLMRGIELRQSGEKTIAQGGHLEEPTPLADRIEPIDPGHFRLHGRRGNQVNIAGKRSSIEFLNAKLLAIDGVVDGRFFHPGRTADRRGTQRLAAVVCAPGLSTERLREALRAQVDPVFLPRPLLLVDHLPVNATGKVTHESLLRLIGDVSTPPGTEPST